MTDNTFAFGLGVGTHNNQGQWLEIFFPQPILAPSAALAGAVADCDSGEALDKASLKSLQQTLEQAGETGDRKSVV